MAEDTVASIKGVEHTVDDLEKDMVREMMGLEGLCDANEVTNKDVHTDQGLALLSERRVMS